MSFDSRYWQFNVPKERCEVVPSHGVRLRQETNPKSELIEFAVLGEPKGKDPTSVRELKSRGLVGLYVLPPDHYRRLFGTNREHEE